MHLRGGGDKKTFLGFLEIEAILIYKKYLYQTLNLLNI